MTIYSKFRVADVPVIYVKVIILVVLKGKIKKRTMRIRTTGLLFFMGWLLACSDEKIDKQVDDPTFVTCEFCLDSTDFPTVSERYVASIKPQIATYYQRYFDSLGFNGAFLVAKNGQILFERYEGYSNYRLKHRMTSTTPIHLASVGKVLTASAIFRLIEKKKLRLDQKVNTVLPEFPYAEITIRMLLNHRSGIPKYANFTEPDSVWGVEKTLRNRDILQLLHKHAIPLDFIPDTKFVYCNTNYALLALLVEKVTNCSFKEAMKQLVFEPLGMHNSFVFLLEKDRYKVSQSYNSRYVLQRFDQLDAIYGDKNIYSTPRDLLKFDLALQKDDFISEQLKNEIFKGYSYERAGVKNYGLGIRLKEWDSGQKIFYHNGWWHGNTSAYITLKKEGVTLIALSNKYTRKVYDIIRLSSLFGDYPFQLNEEDESLLFTPVEGKVFKDTLVDDSKYTRTKKNGME